MHYRMLQARSLPGKTARLVLYFIAKNETNPIRTLNGKKNKNKNKKIGKKSDDI